MHHRWLVTVLTVFALVAWSIPAASQTQTATAGTWVPPLTPWGDPDLQGQWNSQTSTPLQRPLEGPLAGRDALTVEEAETRESTNRANFDRPPRAGSVGNYNAFWRDIGKALTRTSLIIDPTDGRIPALSPEGAARISAERAERRTRGPSTSPDTYADLSQWTRCVSRGWNGIGSWYSSNYQIFQSPGHVVVFQELIHEARIIPLDGRPHLPEASHDASLQPFPIFRPIGDGVSQWWTAEGQRPMLTGGRPCRELPLGGSIICDVRPFAKMGEPRQSSLTFARGARAARSSAT